MQNVAAFRNTGTSEVRAEPTGIDWTPSRTVTFLWALLGSALAIVGVFAFGTVWTLSAELPADGTLRIEFLVLLAVATGVLLLHEAIHGAFALLAGGRPRFGAKLLHKFVPVLYCTVPGHMFSRVQFVAFAMAPVVLISGIGVLVLAITSFGPVLVAALAINLGGAIGDFWMSALVMRQPRGTRIEDREDGIRIHVYPAGAPSPS